MRNTSARDSREVVQVYLQPAEADQPVRLVGWAAADVPAGRVRDRDRLVRAPAVASLGPTANGWAWLADGGELLVARGLGDVRHRLPLA